MKLLLLAALPLLAWGQNDDLFTYGDTNADARIFGPRDWENVACDDLETCTGYPEKWLTGMGWELESENHCKNCEVGDACGDHHQTPVNLDRNWGARKQLGDIGVMNCGDNHWMKYENGTCTWDNLKAANAITVERHALRIAQPIVKIGNTWELDCVTEGKGRIFSRLDMSGGFSQWWWLNHVEIKTPSEHTQNGKRYAAEVHLGHFYSAPSGVDNGSDNRMATIGVFLDARDDIEPYPYLDKLICEFRRSEENVRKACGIESVKTPYPGCFNYNRIGNTTTTARDADIDATRKKRKLRKMVIDPEAPEEIANEPLGIDPRNYREAEWTEEQWAEFQEEYSRQHPLNSRNPFEIESKSRHLVDYDHLTYFPHQFMLDVRSEFYFRYDGTMTIPPCHATHRGGSNSNTNLWRFIKDPIRIHTRQVKEMHRLLKERIAPIDSLRFACLPDTAARVEEDGSAWVARPLQELTETHNNYFCECEDWGSKIPEERLWCQSGNREREYRWFTNPYNFDDNGAF